MDIPDQASTHSFRRLQHLTAWTWYILRSFKATLGFFTLLMVVLFLGYIIPQQNGLAPTDAADNSWIANFPTRLLPLADALRASGFTRILQSPWFWVPAGLLLLQSLIALADYVPISYQRLVQPIPAVRWQHPLACRIEQSVRLPSTPDDFLKDCKTFLENAGFVVMEQASDQTEQRMLGAARRRWSWSSVVILYAGLIALIGAFWISHFVAESDRLTLSSFQVEPSGLLDGRLILESSDTGGWDRHVNFFPKGVEQSPQTLTWRLYMPTVLDGIFILPTAVEPILTIEVRDERGNLLDLALLQDELTTADRLNISLRSLDSPVYFTVPGIGYAFQVSPDPSTSGDVYNVQVQRGSETTLVENKQVLSGQTFAVENLTVNITRHRNLNIIARRDPALPLYFIAGVMLLAGVILSWQLPPSQIWLIPEIRGRGGQLYAVMEQLFGSEKRMGLFLEQLLAADDEP